ncbi:MAG: hypothetical protein AABX38_05835 [Candidatus Micrarchaeota archaeon]
MAISDHKPQARILALERSARTSNHRSIIQATKAPILETLRPSLTDHIFQSRRLKIYVRSWYVRIGFGLEDSQKLKYIPIETLEKSLKTKDAPRKTTYREMHLLEAVLLVKHILLGYEKEKDQIAETLRGLDLFNASLAANITVGCTNSQIDQAIAELSMCLTSLAHKKVAIKKLLAPHRIQSTIQMLEDAKLLEGGKRKQKISQACAKFTSARARLEWRENQIEKIAAYNQIRLNVLEIRLDKWLLDQLFVFADKTLELYAHINKDRIKLAVLARVQRRARKGPDIEQLKKSLKKDAHLFTVPERQKEGADAIVEQMRLGLNPIEGRKIDFLIGHYRWLYRYIQREDWENVKRKVAYLKTFVNGNKPAYIIDQLDQLNSEKFNLVLVHLKDAFSMFELKRPREARFNFEKAEAEMRKIMMI